MTHKEIIQRLKDGNQRYCNDKLNAEYQDSKRRKDIVDGQDPFAIVLSCADSRVVPETIFDTGLGELFVVRVAGNVANTSSVASIEYAVAHLKTKIIVVLGHQNCGAVTAAVEGGDNGPNMNHLLAYIRPALKSCGKGAEVDAVIRKNTLLTKDKLKDSSQIIKDYTFLSQVEIIPAYYNLDSGEVEFMND